MARPRPFSSGDPSPQEKGGPRLEGLLKASSRGDEDAFAALYDEVAARVNGLVLRVVRDPAQAEEVTQDVFVEIWRTAARFDSGKGNALSWMMTIAHRRAVDRVRSSQSARERDQRYHDSTRPVAHDSTAEQVHASLDAQRVRTAMQQLTDNQRGALELAYFGGYTHTEVAALLDLPLGTAKTRIRDGLIRLRDAWGLQP